MTNSRAKGAAAERELANILKKGHGFEGCRRGQQFSGGNDSPDVMGLDGIHIECKRTEKLELGKFMAQAERDSEGSGNMPCVFHRRSREGWRVTMNLDDWIALYKGYLSSRG